ncbi:MAG: hypothetical protein HOP29_18050 [Phycisphaerales bacterium]|nr:hypothetical protein [Phycisphaerales bacterium]
MRSLIGRCFAVVWVVVVAGAPAARGQAGENSVGVGPVFGVDPEEYGALHRSPAPAGLMPSFNLPVLYDNTTICTPDVINYAVGGLLNPSPGLGLEDWFTTSGGDIVAFDLYVVNGATGAVANSIGQFQFFAGADASHIGSAITVPTAASFRTTGSPALSSVPVYRDAVTNEPKLMRVSVNYLDKTYTVVDAETGVALINPPVQDIGAREGFRLPPGKVGATLRFANEKSLCQGGFPVCGPAMASGGSGNENGLHIISAELCPNQLEIGFLCPNVPGWTPGLTMDSRNSCTGGNVCNLNRPFYGFAMTLYVGSGETGDGNNSTPTADPIVVAAPVAPDCSSDLVSLDAFIGDNATPYMGVPVDWFDCNGDGDVTLIDFGCYQRCAKNNVTGACRIHDQNSDRNVNVSDWTVFLNCSLSTPHAPQCSGILFDPPIFLKDIDLYRISNLTVGHVLSVKVEGDKSPATGPTWDPYLRIFRQTGGVLDPTPLAVSDDYERGSFDAFMTVVVPADSGNALYVGVSAYQNRNYDPNSPAGIPVLPTADDAGGYRLTLGRTNPTCVIDNNSGGHTSPPYVSKHEPDDTMAQADAKGALCHPELAGCLILRGVLGDGSFKEYGQDIDLYKIQLDGARANNQRITAIMVGIAGGGFETELDVAIALYDSFGELIATADQASSFQDFGNDQSRPVFAASVRGDALDGPDLQGIYYLGVMGTGRGLFDPLSCEPIFPAVPPTLLNFPHGTQVALTNDTDLRPTVGGRVNMPGGPLTGCEPGVSPPPAATQQYRINILTNNSTLDAFGPLDRCELSSIVGDDSIPAACALLAAPADRLAAIEKENFYLGNGRFGGHQGDVNFYRVPADPGDLVAFVISDQEQPPVDENLTRSFLGLLDSTGFPFATHDYSHEFFNDAMSDNRSDEIAATVVGTMPAGIGPLAYAMVAIDNGNFLYSENAPFDARFAGTTLSRRFETDILRLREYRMGAAVMNPAVPLPVNTRMFVVPQRGLDNNHTSCDTGFNPPTNDDCFPPILEIDPITGEAETIIVGAPSFGMIRALYNQVAKLSGRQSNNPLIAYDGTHLYVTVEECVDLDPETGPFCFQLNRPLYRINPNLQPTQPGYISFVGDIQGYPIGHALTGMTELGGNLYALDTATSMEANSFRYWNKTLPPIIGNGGTLTPTLPDPANVDLRWDDLDGDIGSDLNDLYVPCTYQGLEPGICIFRPNVAMGTIPQVGKLIDPVTNPDFVPGPRLGAVAALPGVVITSDKFGPVIQYWRQWNATDPEVLGTVTAMELPREFLVRRMTVR